MFYEFKKKLNIIIFGVSTPAGKLFDVILLYAISISVLVVMMDSVAALNSRFSFYFNILEWIFTVIFTIEYFTRIWITRYKKKYIFSFFGVIDFLSVIPTYIQIFFPSTQFLAVIRSLRILRISKVLNIATYMKGSVEMIGSLREGIPKIIIFTGTVVIIASVVGSFMYVIEGSENGYTSIPRSIYWAIVTMTTLGYGDLVPHTVIGQLFTMGLSIMGFGIIIITQITIADKISGVKNIDTTCKGCGYSVHQMDALHCKICGKKLPKSKKIIKV